MLEKVLLKALDEVKDHDDPLQSVLDAIDNYALVLLSEDTWWTYVWPIQLFFSVHESSKSSVKKWWRFLPENFVFQNYCLHPELLEEVEYDEEIYQALLHRYSQLLGVSFIPSPLEKRKLVEATIKIQEATKRWHLGHIEVIEYLFELLGQQENVIYPGHLAANHIWKFAFPQYLQKLGF